MISMAATGQSVRIPQTSLQNKNMLCDGIINPRKTFLTP